ncbi:hypothetical protein Tco_0353413 [Tanacetum coccineum]
MESSNSNSKERELQLTQRLAKQRHSICMTWFEQLETHLHDLYLLNSPYAVDAFKPAFCSFFGDEHQTFKLKMFHNLDQLRLQLERENLHGVNAKTCLQALRTQFKGFLASKGVNATDLLNQGWQQDFEDFTRCEPSAYRRDLLENLDTLEAVIHRAVITFGRLQLQSQDAQINPVQAVDDSLNVSKSSWIESENNNALSTSVNETQLQQHESLVTESTTLEVNLNTDVKALDAGLVITESSRTKSDKHDTSSNLRTYITHVVDANIRPVNDQVPSAEVHLTAPHNVLANEQKHTDQSEPRMLNTNVVADALSRKERIKPLKEENFITKDLHGMINKLKPYADGMVFCIKALGIRLDMTIASHKLMDRIKAAIEALYRLRDKVMLKVSSWKGVIRFGKRGKMHPRYIRPFKIIAKVGIVAYRLELPEQLTRVHSTFHVFNLKKCLSDETLAIPLDEVQIDDKLHFIEEPVKIMDHEVKHLKQSRILIFKVH